MKSTSPAILANSLQNVHCTFTHTVLTYLLTYLLTHSLTYSLEQQWRTQDFFSEGGGSKNSVEDREQRGRGTGGGSPLVRGSGGSCNLVQEISFHTVKFS